MVKCESEVDLAGAPPGGGLPGLGGLDSAGGGFRLDAMEAALPDHDPLETLTSTSASSYSIYKQRIDSMFDETRSLISGYGYTTAAPASAATGTASASAAVPGLPLPPPPPPPPLPTRLEGAAAARAERRSRKDANVVQARIEKMFAEMSSGGGRSGNNTHDLRGPGGGTGAGQRFSVDYLGSVPLVDKVTTLQGLQGPLKDLYFGYRHDRAGRGSGDKTDPPGAQPGAQPAPWQPGFLEISGSGLRVHHGDPQQKTQGQAGALEQLNPFPRIAVWAAVQFVCRQKDAAPSGTRAMECAFLPLIADPAHGGVDKDALFRDLSGAEERVIRSMRSILRPAAADADPDHQDAANHDAPMFAVVMRGAGASRQLECHGFVCASSEDAIVMAANLYQALMASMRASVPAPPEAGAGAAAGVAAPAAGQLGAGVGSGERLLAGRIARMHHENGIGRLSIAGSVCGDSANGHATDSANSAVSAAASLSLSAESSCSNADRAPEDAATLAAQQQAKQLAKQAAMKVNQQRSSPPQLPKVPPPVPKRPPRKKKTSGSSTDGEDLIVLEDKGEIPRNNKTNTSSLRGSYVPGGGSGGGPGGGTGRQSGSRRSSLIPSSDVGSGPASTGPGPGPGGDILTKVAIPRSHSFLNANGPLTRYGRRPPNHARNAPGAGADPAATNGGSGGGLNGLGRAGGGGGSPLGFNELFTEFRQQEGLDSLDDILGAIIDAEGMSFNDLKPIYKEFLLKLALTLTKDELYHRSKSIMRRQRKKQLLGAGLGGGRGRRRGIAYTAVYIKRAVRRSINKLRPSKRSGLGKLLFSGGSSPAKGAGKIAGKGVAGAPKKKSKKKLKPVPAAASSISSYPSSNFRMSRRPSISVSQAVDAACNVNVNVSINNNNNNNRASNKARLPRRRSSRRAGNRHHHQPAPAPQLTTSTSEDSDFFTMIRCDSSRGGGRTLGTLGTQGTRSGKGGMNRSSSGYVSCSDCSYDSESCTCLSAERCYCSLSKYRPPPDALPLLPVQMHALRALALQPCACACDTDSCQGSDKCYCTQRPVHAPAPAPAPAPGPGACTRRSGRGQDRDRGQQEHHARCGQRQRQRRGSSTPAIPVAAASASAVPPPANIFEQLRQQGFAASDSSLSRAESPMTAWRKNESRVSGRGQRGAGAGGGGGAGAGAGERRKQRASSSAGSMRSSRSLEFLQGPLLGSLQTGADLQGHLQGHLLPQHQYPVVGKHGKPLKSSGKPPKSSSRQPSPGKVILDGFGSTRSRCPSRMDMYRSSTRSCSYIGGTILEPPALGLGLGRQARPRLGPGTRAGSRPPSRAESRADSWVCEDEDADEPVDDDDALGMDEDVHLLLGDASSTRRSRQSRQSRQARERKVLVVSARDPEGRVIYMGASAAASASSSASARMRAEAGHGGVRAGQFFPRASLSHSSSSRRQSRGNPPRHAALAGKKSDPYQSGASMARAASEALSVKKSAEIAALFTGVKVSQTTDIVATARSTDVTDSRDSSTTAGDGEDLLYSSLDGHSRAHGLGQRAGAGAGAGASRQGMFLSHTVGSNLENSLGYLP
ncbi:hypothetical protein KUF71_023489 [Frankliniella fusca]|uniref:PID domain-containing protein n=1 Tax=Frankliniella fusca TaxID=407009 RepID=A0AAE1LBM9_9NEOP|nr:hypothetical protein KUF71_023489 [Frankliniella fusca]